MLIVTLEYSRSYLLTDRKIELVDSPYGGDTLRTCVVIAPSSANFSVEPSLPPVSLPSLLLSSTGELLALRNGQ